MCQIVPMELQSISVRCKGRLVVQEIIDFGIQHWQSSNCLNKRGADGNIMYSDQANACLKKDNYNYMKKKLEAKCIG